ncbi:MAG: NACHT domain-containing protein, partial [Proteobacteria bacterium]
FLVWDGERLSMLLKEHPEIVDDFFERNWVAAFCGNEVAQKLGQRLNHAQTEAALTAYHLWLRNSFGHVVYRGFPQASHSTSVLELSIELVYIAPFVKPEGEYLEHFRKEREILHHLETSVENETRIRLEEELRQSKDNDWRFFPPSNLEQIDNWGLTTLAEYQASVPIDIIFKSHSQCVILGSPGAGKSLLMRWLALELIREQIDVDLPPATAKLTDGSRLFPIVISLASFANAVKVKGSLSLFDFIVESVDSLGIDNLAVLFKSEWTAKRCWTLLDGLDEVADAAMRAIIVQKVESFLASCGANRCTITSRKHGYERVQGLTHFYLQGFNPQQISEFIFRWYLATAVEDKLGQHDLDDIHERHHSIISEINANEHLRALAANPLLMVAMLIMHKEHERLPQSRVEIYESMTQTLLETWNRWRSQEQYDIGGQKLAAFQLRKVLEKVALWSRQEKVHGVMRRSELKRQIISALMYAGLE